jgi:CRISPR system Cascade subunit CasD
MPAFLLFTLHAPLASWGDIAVGERRGTWRAPSRSAVLGLCGAALGVLRDDTRGQQDLVDGYRVAVRIDAGGVVNEDYHTIQTVAAAQTKRVRPATRAALLAIDDRETILSRRSYLENSLFTVAMWAHPEARWSLSEIAHALRTPVFALYAGRKAHPLGLPARGEVVEAPTLADAFASRPPLPAEPRLFHDLATRLRGHGAWGTEVLHDPCEGFASGMSSPSRRETPRDVPYTRSSAWRFVERPVYVSTLPATAGNAS